MENKNTLKTAMKMYRGGGSTDDGMQNGGGSSTGTGDSTGGGGNGNGGNG
ncbi:hypothetical protein [Tenacibaculum aiptasiae]|nr:hypothetical protein [Tenacibaculum aiptasiae]